MSGSDEDPTLNTRVPEELMEQIDEVYEGRGFSNRSEFVRSAIRDALNASHPLSENALEDIEISREQIEEGQTTEFEEVLESAGVDMQPEGPPEEFEPESADAIGIWGTEEFDNEQQTEIKVIGCGGAGSRLIGWFETVLPGYVETIAIDSDREELERINADTKTLLQVPDENQEDPIDEIGDARTAMEATRDQLEELLEPANLVFLFTGLGGNTGTGAAPIVADAARNINATVPCVATLPHELEVARRRRAWEHIEEISGSVDTFALVDPAKFANYSNTIATGRVFEEINRYIVESITQLIKRVDDFNMIHWEGGIPSFLDDGGFATLISSSVEPDEEPDEVAADLFSRSLIDTTTEGPADRAILLMRGSEEITQEYVTGIVQSVTGNAEHVAWVYNTDETLSEELRITGIVTGLSFDERELREVRAGDEIEEEGSLVLLSSQQEPA